MGALDEFMFNVVEEYVEKHPDKAKSYFACTVGKKPSTAQTFLNDTSEVHRLIESLGKVSKSNMTYGGSSVNLRNLGMTNLGMPSGAGIGLNSKNNNYYNNNFDNFNSLNSNNITSLNSPFGVGNAITEEETEDEGIDIESDNSSSKLNRFSNTSLQNSDGSMIDLGPTAMENNTFNTDFNKFPTLVDQGLTSNSMTGNKKLAAASRSLSMNDLAGRDTNNRTPKCMTWSKYVQTIQEGNDEDAFYF